MKRIAYITTIIGLMFLSVTGCKRDSDVLATFADSAITRGEFYQWIDARKFPRETILKKKTQQKNRLERLALEKILVKEAEKAGYDKTEGFKFLMKLAERNFYAGYMGKMLSGEGEFKEEAAKVRLIKLMVKNYKVENNKRVKLTDAELEGAHNEKIDKARGIIKEIAEGKSFDEMAQKYSDDFSKKKGGDIGYVIEGMRGEDFSSAVFALKEGEISKDPVRIGNGVYIFKVDDRTTLTVDNIDDVIEDERQQQGLKKRLMMQSARKKEEMLLNAGDVVNNIGNVQMKDPNAVIFKVGEKEFKGSDLNELIKYVEDRRKSMGREGMGITDKIKLNWVSRILREEVLMREAIKRGLDKEEKFKSELELFRNYNLSASYENDAVFTDIKVQPAEVQDFYNKNKDRMYTRKEKVGGKQVSKVIPFNTVKDRIEYMLYNKLKAAKRKEWETELLKKYNFVIDESELEGD